MLRHQFLRLFLPPSGGRSTTPTLHHLLANNPHRLRHHLIHHKLLQRRQFLARDSRNRVLPALHLRGHYLRRNREMRDQRSPMVLLPRADYLRPALEKMRRWPRDVWGEFGKQRFIVESALFGVVVADVGVGGYSDALRERDFFDLPVRGDEVCVEGDEAFVAETVLRERDGVDDGGEGVDSPAVEEEGVEDDCFSVGAGAG